MPRYRLTSARQKQMSLAMVEPCVNNDPLVQELYRLVNEDWRSHRAIADKAGLAKNTLTNWFKRTSPKACDLQAALNVIGYRLEIVKVEP